MPQRLALLVILIASLFALGSQMAAAPAAGAKPEPSRDGVFVHLSHGHDDPHRALMALRMAELMAADHDVLVYFDIAGVEVVLEGSKDLQFAQFPNAKAQLATLIELGVPLYACPGCLEAAGKSPADLRKGVQVANKDAFFDFTEGRILTLDY
jgi:predicted peroxiredoxin